MVDRGSWGAVFWKIRERGEGRREKEKERDYNSWREWDFEKNQNHTVFGT